MKIQDHRGQTCTHSPCRRERSQLDINPGKDRKNNLKFTTNLKKKMKYINANISIQGKTQRPRKNGSQLLSLLYLQMLL